MHYLLFGILLGMGAAIPVGPVSLEMIRRNLRFGTSYGIMLGLGACSADITYLFLLSIGALALLQYPEVLKIFGFFGSLILAWFGIAAFRTQSIEKNEQPSMPSLLRYGFEGYCITMINPFTILFWASISSQISVIASTHSYAIFFAGTGVIIGTAGWVFFINTVLHFTRHKLNAMTIKWLNYTGGIILMGFSVVGIIKALA